MTEPPAQGLAVRCPDCARLYPPGDRFCPYDGRVLGDPEADDRIGVLVMERYRLLRRLGRGGMGTVYLATDERLDRLVAVKFVAPELLREPETKRRFAREARNAATVTHETLVRTYDLVEVAGESALIMEYAPGPTLDELIRDSAPLALDTTAALISAMADGLTAMHARGLIHRDLKPSNVVVTRNADGRVGARILDFGIARRFDDASQSITATGVISGTLAFMAPEQVAGAASDVRTDVFSLAAVALVALLGADRRPAYVIAMGGRHDVRLRELPDPLSTCLANGLHTDRGQRTSTARAFADALHAASASLPGWRAIPEGGEGERVASPEPSSASTSSVPVAITKTAQVPLSSDDLRGSVS